MQGGPTPFPAAAAAAASRCFLFNTNSYMKRERGKHTQSDSQLIPSFSLERSKGFIGYCPGDGKEPPADFSCYIPFLEKTSFGNNREFLKGKKMWNIIISSSEEKEERKKKKPVAIRV